jgi:hypothetical protein
VKPGATFVSDRRDFLKRAAAAATAVGTLAAGCSILRQGPAAELHADLVIVGGGVGGCAAALAACRSGLSVLLTEPTPWIGGQFTSQGVPPDEHPWIEDFGCTRSYRAFRTAVREHYRKQPGLTTAARADSRLNPGNGWVSRLCPEPRVALEVLQAMLEPYRAAGTLRILTRHELTHATTDRDRVTSVTVRDLANGRTLTLIAPWFIDATELGDLLPRVGAEHRMGAESRGETGEPHAPDHPAPLDQQAFTWCFALEYRPGEDHVIPRPPDYSYWRDYVPALKPAWSGRLLSWTSTHPITLGARSLSFDPSVPQRSNNLWTYRRIVDPAVWSADSGRVSTTIVNWPQNDYWLGPLVGVDSQTATRHLRRSRELSLSLLYWMQTEAHRPDGGTGWKELRLSPGTLGTGDGLAMAPYVRESRRIRAEFTVLEQHVGVDARRAITGLPMETLTAAPFHDSVGIGAYRIDLHPGTGGGNYIDIGSLPFQIPLGALIPQRLENLIAGGKNLGVTHITNGCYRLHPVEWNIGEAAGALAAWCQGRGQVPRQVRATARHLEAFQAFLDDQGVERSWPRVHGLVNRACRRSLSPQSTRAGPPPHLRRPRSLHEERGVPG